MVETGPTTESPSTALIAAAQAEIDAKLFAALERVAEAERQRELAAFSDAAGEAGAGSQLKAADATLAKAVDEVGRLVAARAGAGHRLAV